MIETKDPERVVLDTTVQEKAVVGPTFEFLGLKPPPLPG